ncbi:hypothetical protein PsorP6_013100 [Peronosclerospora sorghi]|uniref:Uncharacterized protein n=1 Tax=Peronosclerospora sorghi TaxID=230839 RepID=A0ACC0WGY1_9STRA|nr:hypothetical protein PsorP6_013100 [Peronosclerospora sorghi]
MDEDEEEPLPISGIMTDSTLLTHDAKIVWTLQEVRKLPIKVEQVTPKELQYIIHDYLNNEWINFHSHDDRLAAIQVQPAYFRRSFTLAAKDQQWLYKVHALYLAMNAEPLHQNEMVSYQERLPVRLGIEPGDLDATFARLFPDGNIQAAAINTAISDLFLMIYAPGIYFDPVKVQALLPEMLPPKRIHHAPLLLWSDINLICIARTDVSQIFLEDERTPSHGINALRYLSQAELPPTDLDWTIAFQEVTPRWRMDFIAKCFFIIGYSTILASSLLHLSPTTSTSSRMRHTACGMQISEINSVLLNDLQTPPSRPIIFSIFTMAVP